MAENNRLRKRIRNPCGLFLGMPESASVAVLYAGAVAGSLAGSFAVVHNMLADCMIIRWAIRGIVYVGIRKAEMNARANRRV